MPVQSKVKKKNENETEETEEEAASNIFKTGELFESTATETFSRFIVIRVRLEQELQPFSATNTNLQTKTHGSQQKRPIIKLKMPPGSIEAVLKLST